MKRSPRLRHPANLLAFGLGLVLVVPAGAQQAPPRNSRTPSLRSRRPGSTGRRRRFRTARSCWNQPSSAACA